MYITNGQDTFIKLPVLQFIYSYLAYLAKIIKVYNISSLIERIITIETPILIVSADIYIFYSEQVEN